MNVLTLLELAAAMDGDRVALGSRSYAELLDLAARAGTLLGQDPGRPVLYADVAAPALPVAFLGAAWAGRPFAPLSYRLAPERLRALVEAQAPATLIDPAGFLDAVAAAPPAAGRWPEDPDLPALLLHTSGTTGAPKVAILRHGHLTSYVLETVEPMTAEPDEATLVSVPPYHVAGMVALLTSLYAGRRIVQLPSFDPAAWVELVRAEQVTHAMVVPTMLHRILPLLENPPGLPSLRHLSYGGGRMPLPLIGRALELLPGVDFVNAYGLTETSSTIAVLGPGDHRAGRKLGSVGRPLPGVEIEIRDGQVWVRGPQVSGEYADRAAGGDGWFATGDAGRLDDDGYLYVEGRLDDVIVRGGENLSPGEIEDALLAHPEIEDVAVFGVPDDQWGEVVAAAVVLRAGAGLTEDDVRAWVAGRLRSSRAPAVVRFLPELPRTDTGKVLRRELRATT
jgi:acyl-CoA synthetase (AMP-forming)/AMP-acid ligase II